MPVESKVQVHAGTAWKRTHVCTVSEAWILTEGLYYGASREIGDIFQEDLKRSEWSEVDNHADIPLIGIAPWGVVASQEELMGIYVST